MVLTLMLNGSTTQFLLHFLGMDRLSASKRRILEYTKFEMRKKALEAFRDLGEDEELGPADWLTVKRYIKSLGNVEGEQVHPHDTSEMGDNHVEMNIKDIRVRLLNGVQAAYWVMLDEGRITESTANILMQSVDEALDKVAHEPLCDWKGLKRNVHFPSYYRVLQGPVLPRKLVTFFVVQRLESACYICATFLRAHRTARQQLYDFIGESEIASMVINESEAEGEEARNFLEDVRISFPEVLRVVKTRQATHSVLKHLIHYVESLEKAGLLEEKEMLHLHEAVQTDLKRLLRNPPLVKLPKIGDLISSHPLLGALPAEPRLHLVGSTKEIVKLRGLTLCKEGSRPNGIWLISNGVVKWASNSRRGKLALHPIFTHGSTLGLYEVLIGKPYLCDMIADSVVVCFFIETQKVQSLLGSYPEVEDFLWKESVIVLAKILLPQIFEKMSMQDLRVLISESSTMNTYLSGESVEVPSHSIGLLLEGFIKSHFPMEEIIAPPAVLWPGKGNLSCMSHEGSGYCRSTSFSHHGVTYHVETRARVILFDMGVQAGALQRPKSSFLQHEKSTTSLVREHGGLLSWPENCFKSEQHQEDTRGMDEHVDLLGTAMQLSIFGSKVENITQRGFGFEGAGPEKTSAFLSLSYPRVPVERRTLTSVKSEGSANVKKRLEEESAARETPGPPPSHSRKPSHFQESSDDSGPEDDVIVRIDSPSRLSFQQGA